MIEIGRRNKVVALQRATRVVSPAGFTDTWVTYASPRAAVEPATPSLVERLLGSTITTPISHLVTIPYHAAVRSKDRVFFRNRALYIEGLQNPKEENRELLLACQERAA